LWHPLQEVKETAELVDYPFPDPNLLAPGDDFASEIQKLKENDTVVTGRVDQPFKIAQYLRGMENLLCDYLLNPEIVEYIYDRLYSFITAQGILFAKSGVDVVQIIGDIAMQDRLLMSPATWRQFDKPRLASFIKAVKRANSSSRVYMHSDGKLTEIMDDLIETGLDILNPIQPECMDPVKIKNKWGDKIVLHGTVSLQRTLPCATTEQVRDEIRYLIKHCGCGGGYVLGPSNKLFQEIPAENIIAMYEAVYQDKS